MPDPARLMLTPITPDVPDSLRIEEFAERHWLDSLQGKPGLSIALFPEASLRRVGAAWTEALVARAKEIRAAGEAANDEPEDQEGSDV